MRRLPLLLVLAAACRAPAPPEAALPAPSPPPVPVDAAVAVAIDAARVEAPAPGMITDEECVKHGGHVDTIYPQDHGDGPSTAPPTRVCRVPSPMNGHDCRDAADCQGGRCFCTGALDRPNADSDPQLRAFDRTPGTGVCREQTLPPGAWFCLVVGGEIRLQGIIID